MNNWRLRQPLNDDELLAAAEEAVVELANLPVDNEMITDEEQSDEEDEYSEIKNVTTLLDEENVYNENATYELEANTEVENNTPLKLLRFHNQRKAKKEERQKRNRRGSGKRGRLLPTFLHTAWMKIRLKNTLNTAQLTLITFLQCWGQILQKIFCTSQICMLLNVERQ
ncbi:hypothetical protein JTB14_006333 [Gonioctena quinquepunctata]|nr:hypothetical protein JTB14_006333 [Gonioctena quinquepunctata]